MNRSWLKQIAFVFLLPSLTLSWANANTDIAERKTIELATSNVSPYSNQDDPSVGYVNELITEAFKESDYNVSIQFFPHARAVFLAESGRVNGIFPYQKLQTGTTHFLYSDPIPGGKMGLLKLRYDQLKTEINTEINQSPKSPVLIGAVRGAVLPLIVKKLTSHYDIVHAQSHENLLAMLAAGRIDYAISDKYSVSEIIINTMPYLVGKVEFIEDNDTPNEYYLAISKQYEDAENTLSHFNRGLKRIKQNGIADEILQRYGIFTTSPSTSVSKHINISVADINAIHHAITLTPELEKQFPETEFRWYIMEESVYRRRLLGDFALSQSHFDIIMTGSYEIPIWARNGWLAEITALDEDYDLDDFFPAVKQAITVNNRIWAFPFVAESTALFYRKDILASKGIELPSPLTYQQLKEIAKRVHSPESNIYGIGLRTRPGWGQNMALLSIIVNAYGGQWFDEQWRPSINTKPWVDAVRVYRDMLHEAGPPDLLNKGWRENQQLFADGNLVFFIDATSLAGYFTESLNTSVRNYFDVTDVPIGVTSDGARWFWSWNLSVSAFSENQTLAKEVAKWLTSKAFIQQCKTQLGVTNVPSGTRKSTYDDAYFSSLPYAEAEYRALSSFSARQQGLSSVGTQFVPIPEFTAVGYQVGLEIHKAIMSEKSVERALEDAQRKVELIMKNAQLHQKKFVKIKPS
ncbi:extracellular solute-binding protein [Aestuariibacter sp. AA17]|uniref:Extracellular solute-binding protein n=1 Tax=Fluctibacter corallii TaxID=2984329 RepID=A0ABT3A5C3_9ALTE|nr:extracellular solute-binding protein [Aestuariibacter sp. AA17]MCV2883787.1 extracellular solute-binding protein [Aestuariibacter sp. AA17]